MSWQSIEGSQAWLEFWSTKEVAEIRAALENQLRRGALDLEGLGRVRGQLDMMDRLKTMVEKLAQQERTRPDREELVAVNSEKVSERSRMRRLFGVR